MTAPFRAAGANNKDQVSNPLRVASLLVHMALFCHCCWNTQRRCDFTSVPSRLTVTSQTAHELPLEAFQNRNGLEKGGHLLTMELPVQVADPRRFSRASPPESTSSSAPLATLSRRSRP
jgi:hypothetical protein